MMILKKTDEKNEKIISDLINPTPGLFLDDQLNLEDQFKYKSNNIERSFALTNQIQQRLDNVLEMMVKNNRPPSEIIVQKPIEEIPNTPLNNKKTNDIIKTEDIFTDDDYVNVFKYFPSLSTDDRKYFEIKVSGGDLIAYKSPLLTTVNISKKQLKDTPNKILEDLNEKITDFTTTHGEDQNLKRIQKIEQFINKIDFDNKEKIEKNLDKNKWLKSLIDNQIKNESLLFGLEFEENMLPKKNRRSKRKKIPYENTTKRKRKQVMPEIPADQRGKIEVTKRFLIKLLNKYLILLKTGLIYNTTKKLTVIISKKNGFRWKNQQLQNLFRSLQNNPKSVFYTTTKLTKALIKKAKTATYVKDRVFVNLYDELDDKDFFKNENLPLVTPYIDKRTNIDHSMPYSFNTPFEILYADIADFT